MRGALRKVPKIAIFAVQNCNFVAKIAILHAKIAILLRNCNLLQCNFAIRPPEWGGATRKFYGGGAGPSGGGDGPSGGRPPQPPPLSNSQAIDVVPDEQPPK